MLALPGMTTLVKARVRFPATCQKRLAQLPIAADADTMRNSFEFAHPGSTMHFSAFRAFASRVAVVAFCCALAPAPGMRNAEARGFEDVTLGAIRASQLPPEGRATLATIHAGGPFVSPRDGIVFGNRERILPRRPRGYYAEYTVPTPGARNRGARRIIAGHGTSGDFRTSAEYYYTDDHYQTFRRITE